MQPVPVSDAVAQAHPKLRRITVGAPPGMEDEVRPIEVLMGPDQWGPVIIERWAPDADELAMLQAGGQIELKLWMPQLVVHSMGVYAAEESDSEVGS